MRYVVRYVALALVLTGSIVSLCGCVAGIKPYSRTDTAMGTVIQQTVYSKEQQAASEVQEKIMQELTRLEKEILSWREDSSLVHEINASAGENEGCILTEEMNEILDKVWKVSKDSGGALDVTVGTVARLWNIDAFAVGEVANSFQVPDMMQLKLALSQTGYEKVLIHNGRIYLPQGMSLDFGAVGKGIACDRILTLLRNEEISGAVVSVGGSIITYGQKSDSSAWQIAILDPHDTSSYLGTLSLVGEWCVSTSGDYERYVEADGKRYHHILDPDTGYPADSGLRSVTVLCRDGCLSDALSTACFVLGKEEALKLLEKYEAYAVMVDRTGNVIVSEGMEAYFEGFG